MVWVSLGGLDNVVYQEWAECFFQGRVSFLLSFWGLFFF